MALEQSYGPGDEARERGAGSRRSGTPRRRADDDEVLPLIEGFDRRATEPFELYRARSRLYRNEMLQVNMRLKALAEIYTMHSFALL